MNTQPNIIFILTDQFRGDCLGIKNHPTVRTPNLDELGAQGAVFPHAYSPCPSCIAARASIFTGQTPSNHGRLGYQDRVPWRYERMLPQVLGDHGYQTHCVGKTHFYPQRAHLGFHSLESYECKQNFDGLYVNDYFDWLRDQTNGRYTEEAHGLNSNSWVARPSHLPEELHNNSWVATRGIDFIRRRDKTRPFFLNLSFHRPHPPIDPPRSFWDMYDEDEIEDIPRGDWSDRHRVPLHNVDSYHGQLDEKQLKRMRRGYYAQISHIDNQIGRVLEYVKRTPIPNTVFIFTSDHGEMAGDHHLFRKVYAYEGSANVPMIVSPVRVSPTDLPRLSSLFGDTYTRDTPVTLTDVYPTVLDIAGIPVPDDRDGISMLDGGHPEGAARRESDREYIHGEHAACYSPAEAMQYVTDGKEKFIWFTQSGEEMFFDLKTDPQETRNRVHDPEYAESVTRWRQRLIEVLADRPQDELTDGSQLFAGKLLPAVRPRLLKTNGS